MDLEALGTLVPWAHWLLPRPAAQPGWGSLRISPPAAAPGAALWFLYELHLAAPTCNKVSGFGGLWGARRCAQPGARAAPTKHGERRHPAGVLGWAQFWGHRAQRWPQVWGHYAQAGLKVAVATFVPRRALQVWGAGQGQHPRGQGRCWDPHGRGWMGQPVGLGAAAVPKGWGPWSPGVRDCALKGKVSVGEGSWSPRVKG